MKKLVAVMISMLLVLSLSTTVFAADKVAAVTVRLTKTEGDAVKVTTNADKTVKLSENMRLFNGYKVKTGKKSYAYLSLDDSKAVKMDKNTKVSIKKQGNKNEVILSTGKLFFDVNKKLTDEESMQIETSNVSMGIRGTSGMTMTAYTTDEQNNIVESHTVIQLYDGQTYLKISDPNSGETVEHVLNAGNTVDVVENFKSKEGEIVFHELKADSIPAFAADEILKSTNLINRLEKETPITKDQIEKVKDQTVKNEAAEETAREQGLANAETVAKKDSTVVPSPDNPAAPPASGNSGGGGSGGNTGGGATPPTYIASGTGTDLAAALATSNVVVSPGGVINIGTEGLTIPAGRTITNSGTMNITGTLINNGLLQGNGTIANLSMSCFYNNGSIVADNFNNIGKFVNNAGASAVVGTFHCGASSHLENNGVLGDIIADNGDGTAATVVNSGTIGRITMGSSSVVSMSNTTADASISSIVGNHGCKVTFGQQSGSLGTSAVFAKEANGFEGGSPALNKQYRWDNNLNLWFEDSVFVGSWADKDTFFTDHSTVLLYNKPGDATITLNGGSVTIPSGKRLVTTGDLEITNATVTINSGGELAVYGSLSLPSSTVGNSGAIQNHGKLTGNIDFAGGMVQNDGNMAESSIAVQASATTSIVNSSALGSVSVAQNAALTIDSSGEASIASIQSADTGDKNIILTGSTFASDNDVPFVNENGYYSEDNSANNATYSWNTHAGVWFATNLTVVLAEADLTTVLGGSIATNTVMLYKPTTSASGIADNITINPSMSLIIMGDATLSNNKTLTVQGKLVNLTGTLVNAGTINNGGNIVNNGIIQNLQIITNQSGAIVTNNGILQGSASELTNNGTLNNNESGTIQWNVGSSSLTNNRTLTNNGTLINRGILNTTALMANSATVTNEGEMSFEVTQTLSNSNSAVFKNSAGGVVTFKGLAYNEGTINNEGEMRIISGAVITNNGVLLNGGTLTNTGTLDNTAGTVTNSGTLTNTGTIQGDISGNPPI